MTTAAADRYPDDRWETAIARRNREWVRWRIALEMWLRAGSPRGSLLAEVNARQHSFEDAERELRRATLRRREEARLEAA